MFDTWQCEWNDGCIRILLKIEICMVLQTLFTIWQQVSPLSWRKLTCDHLLNSVREATHPHQMIYSRKPLCCLFSPHAHGPRYSFSHRVTAFSASFQRQLGAARRRPWQARAGKRGNREGGTQTQRRARAPLRSTVTGQSWLQGIIS